MSEWIGFDQRKVCPNCGDYQTSLSKRERRSTASHQQAFLLLASLLVVTCLLLITLVATVVIKGVIPEPYRLIGLILTASLGLGSILFNPKARKALREFDQNLAGHLNSKGQKRDLSPAKTDPDAHPIIYRLYCQACGHQWEKTEEEWEQDGQKERENLINSPSFLPAGQGDSSESFEKIEWKPPDPSRGVFLVVGLIIISLIASVTVLGVLWALTHPENPYAPVVNIAGLILGLLAYAGLMVVFRFRVSKMIPLVLLTLIVIAIALWLLYK